VDRAFGWSAADERDLDQELQQVAGRGGRVFVSPYVLHPPLSSLHFIRLTSPRFDDQRRQVLDKLSSLDAARVEWVPLGATVRGYFLEDSSGTVSFRSGIGPLSLAH
jgi:hypothetical protein